MHHANTTKPSLYCYTGPTKGWFTFIHHDRLVEYSDNIMERVEVIKTQKPERERSVRLRTLRVVEFESISAEMRQAGEVYQQARVAYRQAEEANTSNLHTLVGLLVPQVLWKNGHLMFLPKKG